MKKAILIILFIPAIIFAQYTTPNTGVNWTPDSLVIYSGGVVTGTFPNYSMINKVNVSANDKVTILPGTVINITGSTSGFDVDGIFSAIGTPSDSIIFTSSTADSLGAYNGFYFKATSVDSLCIISYAKIMYAYYGMRCVDASPTLSDCFLYKCRRPVQLSTSDAQIYNNRMERAYEYAILINLNSNPIIEGNLIAYNNTQGTSAKNQVSIGLQGTNSPVIRNNIIHSGTGTVTGGISLWVSGAGSTSLIENNTIYNNSFGITLYCTSGSLNAQVRNNLIYNNKTNPNALISGSGINVNGVPGNTPVIYGNEIYDNWWGITIQNGTTVQVGPSPNIGNLSNADTTDDGKNIIYNNIQGADVYDLYNNCTNDVWAQNNDWRVYDTLAIENHIFHKMDDSTHGMVNFIPYSLFIPVELTSFTASVNSNSVYLNWSTATETNNKGFNVERKTVNENWQVRGFVNGNGTSSFEHRYSFIDEDMQQGSYCYRLKQIDLDGSYSYSDIIEIEVKGIADFNLYQNYPNPFNPKTTITFNLPVNSFVTLKIFDINGSEIAVLKNNNMDPGSHKITLDASNFSSGVYLYEITAAGNNGEIFKSTKKLLILK